jgi:cytochrome c biogenesis protein CcmG/thiol:disulfide interchange protein DsbE
MKKLARLSLSLVLVFTALVLLTSAISAAEGKAAPDFALKDLGGKDISLDDYKGKVVFLNFWATWCPPCRQEIPGFIEAYEKYKGDGLVILGVAVSDRENSVKNYVEKSKMTYPVAMGDTKIIKDYDPGNAIPTTIVIDRDGNIFHKHVGFMDQSQVEKIFKDLSK